MWLCSALWLAIPFGAVWSRGIRWLTIPLALMLHVMLPTGIASPLTGAAVIASEFVPPVKPPAGWVAVNTRFGRGDLSDFERMQFMEKYALEHDGRVFVFPENTVRMYIAGPWISTGELSAEHKTIVFGTMEVRGGQWRNELLAKGEYSGRYIQRTPMPIAMSKVTGSWDGPGYMMMGNQKVGAVVCYEEMLLRSLLPSLAARPSVLIGASNMNWEKGVPEVESAEQITLEAWCRLFRTPVVSAVNE
jgi:hypothetical protein